MAGGISYANYFVWTHKWLNFNLQFRYYSGNAGIVAVPFCVQSILNPNRVFVSRAGNEPSALHDCGIIAGILEIIHQLSVFQFGWFATE
jgi:hypothetical protein